LLAAGPSAIEVFMAHFDRDVPEDFERFALWRPELLQSRKIAGMDRATDSLVVRLDLFFDGACLGQVLRRAGGPGNENRSG
jgi:hypothetical protein